MLPLTAQMDEPLYPLLSIARLRIGTDGIGVTTLVAGGGCPLHCRWCINAHLLREAPAESVSAEELLNRVRIDDLYFRATGGGVTFGGGESLLHAEFIRSFRAICPPDWHISVETSLAVSAASVRTAAEAVDEFIIDCKDTNPERYAAYTGGDGTLMLSNLRLLLDTVGSERVLVRVPLIPQYNTPEQQAKNAEVLQKMGVTRVNLFSYVIRS